MKFELTTDQQDFAASLDALLVASDTAGAARSWAAGDHAAGLKLWERLAEQGLTMLATEASPVEVCVAFEALGRHAVPGPWVESAAYLPLALGAEIEGVATVAMPRALDADVAEQLYAVVDGALHTATAATARSSVDRARHVFDVVPGDVVAHGDLAAAYDLAVLATAAQLLGAGERVLADAVTYVKQRKQFGREIGSYQAIKHRLADVRIALDFARPLVYGAALVSTGSTDGDGEAMVSTGSTGGGGEAMVSTGSTGGDDGGGRGRAVSAAKVACADAAYLASRTGLQVHGAIGYTQEFDLSVWITKIRALVTAWGTPAEHRARILDSLVGSA